MRMIALLVLGALPASAAAAAEERTTEGVGLTIYTTHHTRSVWRDGRNEEVRVPRGYATVKERRRMSLRPGMNRLTFTDVAKKIEPATVHFRSLTDPEGTFVLEQNYEYDLLSAAKLLDKYIDRDVTLLREDEKGAVTEETVTLLSKASGGYVVRRADPSSPIEILWTIPRVRLGAIPGGLITRPTLVWSVKAKRAGEHLCKVVYETKDVTWEADYTAVVNADDTAIDLSGWVTIDNKSGATYEDAEVKLVAGNVRGVVSDAAVSGTTGGRWGTMRTREGGFKGKRFFEHHLYTLGRTTTLKQNSQKQLELFTPVERVPAEKMLVYFGARGVPFWSSPKYDRSLRVPMNSKVNVYLRFRNAEAGGLGIPLPAGTARVYKEDPDDGSLEFIGEDRVRHSSRDEDVMLRLGSAFDLVGERVQTEFKCDYNRHWLTESFKITLRDHKDEKGQHRRPRGAIPLGQLEDHVEVP